MSKRLSAVGQELGMDNRRVARREEIIDALMEQSLGYCESGGGYPDAIDGFSVPGYVIVAGTSPSGGPDLTIYHWRDVEAWYQRAMRYADAQWGSDRDGWDWSEAFNEVEGAPTVTALRGRDCLPDRAMGPWRRASDESELARR